MTQALSPIGGLLTQISQLQNKDRGYVPSEAGGIKMSPEQSIALAAPLQENAAICAGAGAGKTRLLVERTARLVSEGVDPSRIVVVTFTRKSAQEIRERIKKRLGSRSTKKSDLPTCTTVHALALAILRRYKEAREELVNLVTDEQMGDLLLELREGLVNNPLAGISVSDDDEGADDLTDEELLMAINKAREDMNYYTPEGLMAARFEKILDDKSLTDFTALLPKAVETLKGGLYDFILVDESQDLSRLQRMFINAIASAKSFIWYIGDGDQAIYAFRGADAGVMNELARKAEKRYVLSVNYRSARSIVEAANRLISNNSGRLDIQWKPHRTDQGSVKLLEFHDCESEYLAVKAWLEGAPAGERTALARTQSVITRLKEEGLSACSVHESKGLEWEEVWVMGCEQNLFPHRLCTTSEERRLFYVAMTRAKTNLIMSYSNSRMGQRLGKPVRYRRRPSLFLFEAIDL